MRFNKLKILGLALLITLSALTQSVYAVITTPATINYQGRLLDSSSDPLNGSYTFRFSIWSDADFDAGDVTGAGAIDTGATGYESWQETHAVTTGPFGLFDVDIGSITTLPSFESTTHKFIQIEVKATGDPDTSYEVLDPDGVANLTDRKPLQNQAYANNADTIDNAEIGTTEGDIVVLSTGDVWDIDFIPGGTNSDVFVIDNDDSSAGDITLQFGDTLGKTLIYSQADSWFEFNDDVNIEGDLTVTGDINGVDITNIDYTFIATRSKIKLLEPEYEGSVVELDGSDNKGTLEAEFEDLGGTLLQNFYKWRSRKATLQDIDLVIRTELPLDFDSWETTPVNLEYKTGSASSTDNKIDVTIEDSAGAAVTLSGASALTSTTWATAAITFSGTPTFTAGTPITITIKLSATTGGDDAFISNLKLNYIGK